MDSFSPFSSSKTHSSGEIDLVIGALKYGFKIKGFGKWRDMTAAVRTDHPAIKSEKIVIPLRDGGNRKIQLKVEEPPNRDYVKVSVINCGAETLRFTGTLHRKKVNGVLAGTASKTGEKSVSCFLYVTKGTAELDIYLDIMILTNNPIANDKDGDKKKIDKEVQKNSISMLRKDFASMRESGLMSDVTIICEGATFPAHKLILATRSEVFAAMFSHKDTLEDQQQEVEIKDLGKLTVERLLTYLYEATLPDLSFEDAAELLGAADKYQGCYTVMT